MNPLKILLVDDSAVFARTAKQFIEEAFAAHPLLQVLDSAGSGSEALARIEVERPHLVLMDLNMPGIDGIEATRLIKAAGNAPKVVMISLCDIDELAQAAQRAGADGYLRKDALVRELPALIQAELDQETR